MFYPPFIKSANTLKHLLLFNSKFSFKYTENKIKQNQTYKATSLKQLTRVPLVVPTLVCQGPLFYFKI